MNAFRFQKHLKLYFSPTITGFRLYPSSFFKTVNVILILKAHCLAKTYLFFIPVAGVEDILTSRGTGGKFDTGWPFPLAKALMI